MRAHRILRLAASMSALAAGLTACSTSPDQGEHRAIGLIEPGGSFDALVVPDTVRAGIPFTITVWTFGTPCVRPDGVAAQVSGLVASVTPYVVEPPSDAICPAVLQASPRTVTLAFDTPGAATVRLHGRGLSAPMRTLEETAVVAP
jgi:hypothetical protein